MEFVCRWVQRGFCNCALASTLPRVIKREDYKNRKKRLAPLPTAHNKTSTGSYGVSFCSLSQYNLRHRGDFLVSLPFLRNSTPNISGRHPLEKPKNPLFGVNISWTEAKFKICLGGVNCIEIIYWMIPYMTMWLQDMSYKGGCYTFSVIFTLYSTCVCTNVKRNILNHPF